MGDVLIGRHRFNWLLTVNWSDGANFLSGWLIFRAVDPKSACEFLRDARVGL